MSPRVGRRGGARAAGPRERSARDARARRGAACTRAGRPPRTMSCGTGVPYRAGAVRVAVVGSDATIARRRRYCSHTCGAARGSRPSPCERERASASSPTRTRLTPSLTLIRPPRTGPTRSCSAASARAARRARVPAREPREPRLRIGNHPRTPARERAFARARAIRVSTTHSAEPRASCTMRGRVAARAPARRSTSPGTRSRRGGAPRRRRAAAGRRARAAPAR